MSKTKKQQLSVWSKLSKFIIGALVSAIFGLAIVLTLERGAVIVLVGLVAIAVYVYALTHQRLGVRSRLPGRGSASSVLAALVILGISIAGAYYLNQSFAWRSESEPAIPATPESNNPAYWGASCTKTEFGGNVMTFSASGNTTRVVVKGGPWYVVYNKAPFTDLSAPINGNTGKPYAISHVIVCTGVVTPQTQPAPTPTPPTPTPPGPTPTPPSPTPTPPTPTPPTPTPTVPTTTTPTPGPGTPDPTPVPTQVATKNPIKNLPNVGPGNIAFIAAFALIGGYIFHELYWHIKGNGQAGRKNAPLG